MAEDGSSGIVEAIPVLGDIVEVIQKFGELLEVSVVVAVYNRTNESLVLSRFSQENDGVSQGEFADFPAPDIAPGDDDEFRFDKGFKLSDATDTSNIGFVDYAIGQTGKHWRIQWKNPVIGDPTCTMTITPDPGEFQPAQAVGDGKVAPISTVLRQPGFEPGQAGGGITSRCIITVDNRTDSVLTLIDQGHEPNRGGFFTQPKPVLQVGEVDSFASVETQGVTDPKSQGSAGFLKYRIESPGGGTWTSTWENPEKAQNISDSRVDGVPEGFEYTALDQIGEGDDNVPVTFTLSGGPKGVFDAEWTPPVEVEQPTLRKGDKNADGWVEYLQEQLNRKLNAGLTVDGDFGNATQRAVDRLQRDFDIQEDHVVGNQTWAVLRGETPVPASTDGRVPHTFVEHGAEARWRGEGDQAMTYNPATDLLTLHVVSVGTVLAEGHSATLRFTGNDAGEVFVTQAPLSAPVTVHANGGADYIIEVEGLRSGYGVGVHTVEAYLPAETGGDYITFQVRVE